MIHIFYGDDRLKSEDAAKRVLGENYEVVDASLLEVKDLPTLFLGASLFETSRKILIKSLFDKKELSNELEKYIATPHEIVILEDKLPGTLAVVKALKKSTAVELLEFKKPEVKNPYLVFNIYDMSLKNPKKALEMLEEAKNTEDPYAVVGAFASSAIKNLKSAPNSKRNKKIVKELAKIDILLKTTKYSESPWLPIEAFILRLEKM